MIDLLVQLLAKD